ncbi:MAG: ferrous iron transport protein B [Eubacteriales bacterium]
MIIRIALAGNPNCGKTTLFNALTGSDQYVGNWPGVTVEKKEGRLKTDGQGQRDEVILTDLPGIYSLSPYSPEETAARRYLTEEHPDVILNILDGTNLARNLYLTTQLTELGIPVVIAVNMMDIVEKRGDRIDTEKLAETLGCPVIPISARSEAGVPEAVRAAVSAAAQHRKALPCLSYPPCVEHALAHIEEVCFPAVSRDRKRWYAVKRFERDQSIPSACAADSKAAAHVEADIRLAEKVCGDDAEAIITNERYRFIDRVLSACYTKATDNTPSVSEKIDRIATGRFTAFPVFACIMLGVYMLSVGLVGGTLTGWMHDTLFGAWIIPSVIRFLETTGCTGWLIGLIADGMLGGVCSVLGFLPQMAVLFALLAILEDVGYMARVAFIMDQLFRHFGLSGKSFIPLMIASGCGVPGVMSARTIEQERDRRMTVLTACFIPCGAKMPLVGLIASALFGASPWIAAASYGIGVASVFISGIILKKTKLFSGEPAPFIMELPAYHRPDLKNVLRVTRERVRSFVRRAGTVILLAGVVIWLLHALTWHNGFRFIGGSPGQALSYKTGDESILTCIGKTIAVIFRPLGFGSWQAAVASVLGLLAKEEIVGVFGSLAAMSGRSAEAAGYAVFGGSQAAGFSFLTFNLLCAPCIAAMDAIRREMHSIKWTVCAITYMCVFAYAVSLVIYQVAAFFSGNGSIPGMTAAGCVLCVLLYLIFRPEKNGKQVRHGLHA